MDYDDIFHIEPGKFESGNVIQAPIPNMLLMKNSAFIFAEWLYNNYTYTKRIRNIIEILGYIIGSNMFEYRFYM